MFALLKVRDVFSFFQKNISQQTSIYLVKTSSNFCFYSYTLFMHFRVDFRLAQRPLASWHTQMHLLDMDYASLTLLLMDSQMLLRIQ